MKCLEIYPAAPYDAMARLRLPKTIFEINLAFTDSCSETTACKVPLKEPLPV